MKDEDSIVLNQIDVNNWLLMEREMKILSPNLKSVSDPKDKVRKNNRWIQTEEQYVSRDIASIRMKLCFKHNNSAKCASFLVAELALSVGN